MDYPRIKKVITRAFWKNIDVFMKIFFDDFTIFSDLSTQLEKLKKWFLKCREFGINLNLDKCAFMVFSRTILGFRISKEGKVMDPKKVEVLINMPIPTTPQEIQVFNGMAQFYKCFIKKLCLYYVTNYQIPQKVWNFWVDYKMPKSLGGY